MNRSLMGKGEKMWGVIKIMPQGTPGGRGKGGDAPALVGAGKRPSQEMRGEKGPWEGGAY